MLIFIDESDKTLPFFEVGLGSIHGINKYRYSITETNIRDMLKYRITISHIKDHLFKYQKNQRSDKIQKTQFNKKAFKDS